VTATPGTPLPRTREPTASRDKLPRGSQPLRQSALLRRLLASPLLVSVLFGSTLLGTLTAGLWPFHAPKNDATWVKGDDGIRFSRQGTAISDGMLRFKDAGRRACTLELRLKPASIWTGGTPLDFYNQERRREFRISQDEAEVLLRLVDRANQGASSDQVLMVQNVFRRREVLLTVASNGEKTAVYIDGQMTLDAPHFPLSSEDLAAQLILGNAPRRNHGWAGEVEGLAVYASDLSADDVRQHARQWTAAGRPTISAAQDPVLLYVFRGPWNEVIPNAVTGGVDLSVPQKFRTVDQLRFESALSENHFDDSYRSDAFINILGFVPLGCIAAWFWTIFLRGKGAALAVITGVVTSFVIEYFQSYLPTRYSGTTDLITNSIGTCLGVAVYVAAAWLIAKKNRVGHSDAQSV
jgi:hypothetical protein